MNQARFDQNSFYLSKKDIPGVVVGGKADWPGRYRLCRAIAGRGNCPLTAHEAEIVSERGNAFEGFLAVAWGADKTVVAALDRILDFPAGEYRAALDYAAKIADSVRVETPDKMLNAGMRYVNYSADACWRPPSFLHSSTTWSQWYTGWRDLYGPTICGWHDRVRSSLRFQARHTSALDKFPRNERMSRLENAYTDSRKKATGRIHMSTSPLTGEAGGHHDCDQLFVDFVYHHLCWTGDAGLVRELWPVMAQALKFQKVTRDSDDDGLYVNLLNTWMSDSHEYHQGGCAVQSAYLWKNNIGMAEIARLLGKDGRIYTREAARIKKAMRQTLWLNREGIYADYKDAFGIIHPVPEAPAIYFPIEFGLVDMFQACRMLKYMRDNFRMQRGLIYPSMWFPSICYKAPIVSETLNMALAAYRAGQNELGLEMLSGCFRTYDTGILHRDSYVPFNPQCGCSDGAIDMLDTASLFHKSVVEGLFGIHPQMHKKVLVITPGFPADWLRASIETPDFSYRFRKEQNRIHLDLKAPASLRKTLRLPLKDELVDEVTLNGAPVDFNCAPGIGRYYLMVHIPRGFGEDAVSIRYRRRPVKLMRQQPRAGRRLLFAGVRAQNRNFFEPLELEAPQRLDDAERAQSAAADKAGLLAWKSAAKRPAALAALREKLVLFPLDSYCNGKLAEFHDSVPPEMVYGLRLHKGRHKLDDSHLKRKTHGGIFDSDLGVRFRLSAGENNAVHVISSRKKKLFSLGYLTMLDGTNRFFARKYPSSLRIHVDRDGLAKAYLLFLGATSIMQSYVPAVAITLAYDQGPDDRTVFSNPDGFDLFLEHTSAHFSQPLTNRIERWLPCDYSGHVRRQHADIAAIPVDPGRKLKYMEFSVLAIDTTMALMGLTFLSADKKCAHDKDAILPNRRDHERPLGQDRC